MKTTETAKQTTVKLRNPIPPGSKRFFAFNALTGLYYANGGFTATRYTATRLEPQQLAVVRYTFNNVRSEVA